MGKDSTPDAVKRAYDRKKANEAAMRKQGLDKPKGPNRSGCGQNATAKREAAALDLRQGGPRGFLAGLVADDRAKRDALRDAATAKKAERDIAFREAQVSFAKKETWYLDLVEGSIRKSFVDATLGAFPTVTLADVVALGGVYSDFGDKSRTEQALTVAYNATPAMHGRNDVGWVRRNVYAILSAGYKAAEAARNATMAPSEPDIAAVRTAGITPKMMPKHQPVAPQGDQS